MQHSNKILTRGDIIHRILLVKTSKTYRPGMSEEAKYEAARGVWKVSRNKANDVQYVLSVFNNEVIEVYEPKEWQNAGKTPYKTRTDLKAEDFIGRLEFVGEVAAEPVRCRYVGKSVASLYKKGEQNPIKYIFP